jgi:hypothetical protein
LITANDVKVYSAIANSTEELKIRFKQWLRDVGVETAVINVAKAGAYSYTFGVANRFIPIAEEYLKELGYKVTLSPEDIDDPHALFTRYVTIDWRD